MRGRAILRRCRDLLLRAWGAVRRWFVRNFAGTAPALNVLALAVAALVGGLCLADTYWPVVWGTGQPFWAHSRSISAVTDLGARYRALFTSRR